MSDLLAGQLTILPITETTLRRALELQQTHGLMTNDSLHLAAGMQADITLLATHDAQFENLPGLTVFRPDDVVS